MPHGVMSYRLLAVLLMATPMWLSAQSRLEGVVYDSLVAKAPLAGATVVVRELQRYVTTDTDGRFRIDSVAPGRYTVDLLHSLLDSLDVQLPGQQVDVPAGRPIRLRIPDARGLHLLLCNKPAAARSSLVIGTVRTISGGEPIDGATVDVTWKDAVFDRSGVHEEQRSATVKTVASGAFVLCGVPSDAALQVRASAAALTASQIESRADTTGLRRVDIRLGVGAAPVRFTVRAADNTPLVDAQLRIPGLSPLRTDSSGVASLALNVGSYSAEVVALGYQPRALTFYVHADASSSVPIVMTRQVTTLAPVSVVGKYEMLNKRLDEFYARRTVGLGAFLGPEDLKKVSGVELIDALRVAQGVRITMEEGILWPTMRGRGAICIPNFFVNGVYFEVDSPRYLSKPYTALMGVVPLESVIAIEIYAGLGGIPQQYDRTGLNGCGSIVFWTKY
jgi:hypothetical protein